MLHTKVLELLASFSENKIELDPKVCGIQRERVESCKKALKEALKDNLELKLLYKDLDVAIEELHNAIISHYYKEGFKFGAQLMMEICGYEYTDKNNK